MNPVERLLAELARDRGDTLVLYLVEAFRLRIWYELATGEMQVECLNRRKEP